MPLEFNSINSSASISGMPVFISIDKVFTKSIFSLSVIFAYLEIFAGLEFSFLIGFLAFFSVSGFSVIISSILKGTSSNNLRFSRTSLIEEASILPLTLFFLEFNAV